MKIKYGYLHWLNWAILVVLITGPLIAGASQSMVIRLKSQVSVDNDEFTLDQIADIIGAPNQEDQALGALVMGSSPLPGKSLRIYPALVELRLKQHGVDLERWHLEAQGPILVDRRSSSLASQQLETVLFDFIRKHAPWQPEQMKLRPISYRQTHTLAPGQLDFRIAAPEHSDWLGAETFSVNLLVDGREVKKIMVPVFIEVWDQVVLSAKPLSRGQTIGPGDVTVQRINLAGAPTDAIIRKDQVLGYVAKQPIAVNTILRSDQIYSPPLIRKGEVVQVVAEATHLKITTKAIAQENGAKGDHIELLNLQSKKKIHAQVLDSSTVKVNF